MPEVTYFGGLKKVNMAMFDPYAFDPQRSSSDDSDSSDSDDSCKTIFNDSDSDDAVEEEQHIQDFRWCKCHNCGLPASKTERKCCHDEDLIVNKMGDLECITSHPDFSLVCLNLTVLEVAFYQYCEDSGFRPEAEDIHRKYRYVAYRQFARWIYRLLGMKNRVVLPACVVKKIRQTFPSEKYTGFQYPRLK